jgi:hypothetical protein
MSSAPFTDRVDELAPERRKIIFDPIPRVNGIDSAGDPLTALRSELYLLSGRRRRAATAKLPPDDRHGRSGVSGRRAQVAVPSRIPRRLSWRKDKHE